MDYIKSYTPEAGFDTPERCHINELHNAEEDSTCSIAKAVVKPGVSTQLHKLTGVIERYVILEGAGSVVIDNSSPVIVKKYDTVIIPAGLSQKITNIGAVDLEFLCICTPRFTKEIYSIVE